MPRNLELKAAASSLKALELVARNIGARREGILRQVDTYYRLSHGRLKLREINRQTAELIYYVRPNRGGNRFSSYVVLPVPDVSAAKKILSAIFSVMTVVRKRRSLFLFKNSRIHLDRIAGLGTFVEFEVIVARGEKQANELMKFLRTAFNIDPGKTIPFSYSDLLLKKRSRR